MRIFLFLIFGDSVWVKQLSLHFKKKLYGMKNKIVAGNWKMNKNFSEAEDLLVAVAQGIEDIELKTDIIIFPPFLYLEMAADIAENSSFYVGAQNVSSHESGAYTGEISAFMLKHAGVDFCIVGHSERRQYFQETEEELTQKVNLLLANDICPIYCVGEALPARQAGDYKQTIARQIEKGLFHLSKEQFESVIIAYEPVWAIGTGVTATTEQAQEVHAFIREMIAQKYGTEAAYNGMILYGGSCNPQNALDLFSCNDVDGGLIGGASLSGEDFIAIINAAETASDHV
jgi:triosephosphate isomerase